MVIGHAPPACPPSSAPGAPPAPGLREDSPPYHPAPAQSRPWICGTPQAHHRHILGIPHGHYGCTSCGILVDFVDTGAPHGHGQHRLLVPLPPVNNEGTTARTEAGTALFWPVVNLWYTINTNRETPCFPSAQALCHGLNQKGLSGRV